MTIDHVSVSDKAKQQLSRLKSKTGIQQWNYLCRWAFCLSLQEVSVPPYEDIPADSNLEMTWQTFGGQYPDLYLALLKTRLIKDEISLTDENIKQYFKIHLHRGISYLNRRVGSISDLYSLQIN